MARIVIYSSFPHFMKEVELGEVNRITQQDIEDETITRIRALLGMGKITCEANLQYELKDEFSQWSVDIISGTGIHFCSVWVRAFP